MSQPNQTEKSTSNKVTKKQLEQAQNAYILLNNDMTHKIVSQDFSGRSLTDQDQKEREETILNVKLAIVSLNTLYVKYAYQKLQKLLKKSKKDVIKFQFFDVDEETVGINYDYFLKNKNTVQEISEENTYLRSEDNELINDFFTNMSENLTDIFIELSNKLLTDNNAIYIFKDDTFEQFLEMFDVEVPIGYTIEIEVDFNEESEEEDDDAILG